MKQFLVAAAAAFALTACGPTTQETEAPQAAAVTADAPQIVAALADTRRPQADRDRDANRHAAETLG
jgi:predicted methyltransferase